MVVRRFDDHFVRADSVHAVEQALAFAIEPPSIPSAGNLFGTTRSDQPGVSLPLPLRP